MKPTNIVHNSSVYKKSFIIITLSHRMTLKHVNLIYLVILEHLPQLWHMLPSIHNYQAISIKMSFYYSIDLLVKSLENVNNEGLCDLKTFQLLASFFRHIVRTKFRLYLKFLYNFQPRFLFVLL